MILGFNLLYDLAGNTPYYTTSFPRRGLAALFSIQTTHVRGGLALSATVQHRNREDPSWTDAGTFSGITAPGLSTLDLSSLKEEIRFSYRFTGTGSLGDFFRVFIPPPAWRPYT
jgi:hypothetical protein